MANVTDTSRFLQAVFPDHASHAIFAHNPVTKGMAHSRNLMTLNRTRDCYWSIASFPDDGDATRTMARALEVRALVVDDVGTKVITAAIEMTLGTPTAIVETSAGNFQWVYRLAKPVPVTDWAGFFAGVEALVGQKLEGRDAVHLFRLPMGVNTKPGRGGFHVKPVELNADAELDPAEITSGTSGPPGAGPGPSSGPVPRIRDIKNLVALIPNPDVDYDAWIARAHQVKALALDEVEGAEAFDAWSQKSGKYDADETARRWETVRPSHTAGMVLLADAEAADPAGFGRIMNAEAGAAFDDGVEPPPGAPSEPRAAVRFARGKNKEILTTMANAALALTGLGVGCRYDQFHHRFLVSRGGAVERLTDHLVLLLRGETHEAYGKDFGPVHTCDAIMKLGLASGFNPVCEMLDDAEVLWDGVLRLDRLGPDYFHTEDTEFARAAFRKTMIAAVRRARSPGCKFDQILVTESHEGWNKSSAWAVLAGDGNFSDADILGKSGREVQEELADIWIHEIADLSGLSRADVEHVKAFASRTNDRARPAYGRVLLDQPRQSIEVGTTNADVYLLSPTGNRRFWTFKLGSPVDITKLKADRLALWGEAAAAEAGGETLVLDQKLWGAASVEQEKRRVIDTWEDELANLVEMPAGAIAPQGSERIEVRNGEQFITSVGVNEYLAGYRRVTLTGGAGRKIAEIMKRLGWERCVMKVNGVAARGYTRARSTPSSVTVSSTVTKKVF